MGNVIFLNRGHIDQTDRTAWDLLNEHGRDAGVVAALWMSHTIDAGDARRAVALAHVIDDIDDMKTERLSGHMAPAC